MLFSCCTKPLRNYFYNYSSKRFVPCSPCGNIWRLPLLHLCIDPTLMNCLYAPNLNRYMSSLLSNKTKDIPIDSLRVTQFGIRSVLLLSAMVQAVKGGHLFSFAPCITLFKLDDGNLYIHDGHHRSLAIHLAGRTHLVHGEYMIKQFTFEQLRSVNFDAGYVTPYDPRTEMRLCEFQSFKQKVFSIYLSTSPPNTQAALEYIYKNRSEYCVTSKPYSTIPEMAEHFGLSTSSLSDEGTDASIPLPKL